MFATFFVSGQNDRYINAKSLIELNHMCTSYLDELRNTQFARSYIYRGGKGDGFLRGVLKKILQFVE